MHQKVGGGSGNNSDSARRDPEPEKQKTAANLGLAETPAAKLCALGHHRAQIAARQTENAERQLRLAAGTVEGVREGGREGGSKKKVLPNHKQDKDIHNVDSRHLHGSFHFKINIYFNAV